MSSNSITDKERYEKLNQLKYFRKNRLSNSDKEWMEKYELMKNEKNTIEVCSKLNDHYKELANYVKINEKNIVNMSLEKYGNNSDTSDSSDIDISEFQITYIRKKRQKIIMKIITEILESIQKNSLQIGIFCKPDNFIEQEINKRLIEQEYKFKF
jgi:hypothetical protein